MTTGSKEIGKLLMNPANFFAILCFIKGSLQYGRVVTGSRIGE
jgi:hypothetical protein